MSSLALLSGLRAICAVLLLLSYQLCIGQSGRFHRWNGGQLTWADFRPGTPRDPAVGGLSYRVTTTKVKFRSGDTLVKFLEPSIEMDRRRSWQDLSSRTQASLEYWQFVLDRAELERRVVERDHRCCRKLRCALALQDSVIVRTNRAAGEMDRATAQGDEAAVQAMKLYVRSELERMPGGFRPPFSLSACRIGMFIGAGKLLLPSELAAEFTPSTLLSMGWLFGYRHFVFLFSFEAGNVRAGPSPEYLDRFITGESPSTGQMQGSLGYQLNVAHNCLLIPYAGLGYLGISSGKEETYQAWETRRPVLGVLAFRPFHRLMKLAPGEKEYDEFGMFGDLRAAPLDLGGGASGTTFTVMVGLYFTSNWMKPSCNFAAP